VRWQSQNSGFAEGEVAWTGWGTGADDDVIEEWDAEDFASAADARREAAVGFAGTGIAGRMVPSRAAAPVIQMTDLLVILELAPACLRDVSSRVEARNERVVAVCFAKGTNAAGFPLECDSLPHQHCYCFSRKPGCAPLP
jgi:hypothetical protein